MSDNFKGNIITFAQGKTLRLEELRIVIRISNIRN